MVWRGLLFPSKQLTLSQKIDMNHADNAYIVTVPFVGPFNSTPVDYAHISVFRLNEHELERARSPETFIESIESNFQSKKSIFSDQVSTFTLVSPGALQLLNAGPEFLHSVVPPEDTEVEVYSDRQVAQNDNYVSRIKVHRSAATDKPQHKLKLSLESVGKIQYLWTKSPSTLFISNGFKHFQQQNKPDYYLIRIRVPYSLRISPRTVLPADVSHYQDIIKEKADLWYPPFFDSITGEIEIVNSQPLSAKELSSLSNILAKNRDEARTRLVYPGPYASSKESSVSSKELSRINSNQPVDTNSLRKFDLAPIPESKSALYSTLTYMPSISSLYYRKPDLMPNVTGLIYGNLNFIELMDVTGNIQIGNQSLAIGSPSNIRFEEISHGNANKQPIEIPISDDAGNTVRIRAEQVKEVYMENRLVNTVSEEIGVEMRIIEKFFWLAGLASLVPLYRSFFSSRKKDS